MPLTEQGKVLDNRLIAPDLYVMDFVAPLIAQECQPGQFLHIRTSSTCDPLLRRPFSIYDVLPGSCIISLLYRVVGRGTGLLTNIEVDDEIDVTGPLGRGFSLPEKPEDILLVGGGVGVAPLMYLGRQLIERGCRVQLLLGAATTEQLIAGQRFEKIGIRVKMASLDGAPGYQGLVTDLLDMENPASYNRLYTCGPEAMMARVAEWAIQNKVGGELSLEEHMACGVGACLGCARQLKPGQNGYAKICQDGPVFDINSVSFIPTQIETGCCHE